MKKNHLLHRLSGFALRVLTVAVMLTVLTVAHADDKERIQNPMLWADVPDPDVIRVGDTFYLVSTTMHLMPGAPVMKSKDLKNWERLPNLITKRSPQQRNVVLHPEFVDGKYAFYTRPMDDFIETGSGSGIGFGLCEDIEHPVIDEEKMTSIRRYHQITEAKNGAGAVPIKTDRGWIHIAHGVRNTAAGLRYVIYAFATDLEDPSRVIAEPSGLLIGPRQGERVGDVSNVVFTNGAIVNEKNEVFIYYASSDTRLHVATTTIDKLVDYVFNTPSDPGRSPDCVKQRCGLISSNLDILKETSI